ncbi:MAG: hypothetical protein JWR52_1143 [Marmoricola sp.]|nr:hypothetical protein [Marmoricola sp.]
MNGPQGAVLAQVLVVVLAAAIGRWSRNITEDSWPPAMPLEWRQARTKTCHQTGRLCYVLSIAMLAATVVTAIQTGVI